MTEQPTTTSDSAATAPSTPAATVSLTDAAVQEEQRLIRRLQLMMNLVMQTIAQDGSLTVDEASQMIADARSAALTMFPGKDWPMT
jgi:hypothetical protein